MLRIGLAAGKTSTSLCAVKFVWRNPVFILGLVVLWRVALWAFTAQPIPANDSCFFDGGVVNWLLHGRYVNPSIWVNFPISSQQVYSTYPPLYQATLLLWMLVFGPSVLSAMALHVTLFAIASYLTWCLIRDFFPPHPHLSLAILLLFAITFNDRPESLAHVFGMLALLITGKMMAHGAQPRLLAGLTLALLAGLYTSVISAAMYFGASLLAVATFWLWQRKWIQVLPFFATAFLFTLITLAIAKIQPLWWAGFQENARQTPVVAIGFRLPTTFDLLKLIRTAPVFLLGAALLPWLFWHRQKIANVARPWLALTAGIFLMGGGLLVANMTILSSVYVVYVLFLQVPLAAGLLAITSLAWPARPRLIPIALLACVALVSIRAVGLTTWGSVCAVKNSYASSRALLERELAPLTQTNAPVVLSTAYIYEALRAGVKNPIQYDWYYDKLDWSKDAEIRGLVALRPRQIILVQFDYYRAFAPMLERLKARPELASLRVRDTSKLTVPDSIPKLERVLQHISWAPVIVDLEWKSMVTNDVPLIKSP